MRILWIIDSLGPGGAESLMLPLLSQVKDQVDDPHVCVLSERAGNPIAQQLEKIGIPVRLIPIGNLRNIRGIWQLFQFIRRYRPDLVHTQLEHADILGMLIARILNIPSISTMHTLDVPSKKLKKSIRNTLRWTCLKYIARYVIAVSEFTRQHYLRLGFQPSKLLTLPNGIDTHRFQGIRNEPYSKAAYLGVAEESVVITTVAVLRELKGIQYMLQAMPLLLEKVPQLRYVIVGDGEHRPFLEDLARTLGIADHVIFLGYRNDIPQILAFSDLFAFPTLQDAFPTVLMEAMAAGVPVVASRVDGVPEILENEVSGLLVPPADPTCLAHACLRILCDPELANRFKSAALLSAEQRFTIRRQAVSLTSLYSQVISNHER